MGYWGWRPLVMCVMVSVWVSGCNIVTDSAPGVSPTPSPRVTLTLRQFSPPTPTATTIPASQPARTESVPQASPTPVEYVVQPDDTLGGIALRFGVEVEALRAANEGVDPRALQSGQRLIIPVQATSEATTEVLSLPLEPPTCNETPAGSLLCLGQMTNPLDKALEDIILRVDLRAASGDQVLSELATLDQAVLPPGEIAPYRALFDIDPDMAASAETTVQHAEYAKNTAARFVVLDVRDASLARVGARYVLTAQLANAGEDNASSIRLVVTLIENGHVVGYRVAQVGRSLPAAGTMPVRVEIVPQAPASEPDYHVYVEARRAAE